MERSMGVHIVEGYSVWRYRRIDFLPSLQKVEALFAEGGKNAAKAAFISGQQLFTASHIDVHVF